MSSGGASVPLFRGTGVFFHTSVGEVMSWSFEEVRGEVSGDSFYLYPCDVSQEPKLSFYRHHGTSSEKRKGVACLVEHQLH